MTRAKPHCPYCMSDNVLPFEDGEETSHKDSFSVILLSALFLVLVYFIFLIFSYFNYPLMILITVAVVAFLLGRKEKKRPPVKQTPSKPFVCLECNSEFQFPQTH